MMAEGWERCDNPQAHLVFGSQVAEACSKCGGKGYWYIWDSAWNQTMGQCYRKRCQCRGGKQTKVKLDPEFRAALVWFYKSSPPGEPFEFCEFRDVYKVIDEPAAYWRQLKDDINTGNIYRMEAIRSDVIKLHQILVLANEEFQ